MKNKINGANKEKNNKKIIIILAIVIAVLAVGLIAYLVITKTSESKALAEKEEKEALEKWQEGVISYNGKYYKYNNYIKSYLFMGIDKSGPVEEVSQGGTAGQADVLFLLVEDKKNETLSAIAINRNTMTEIGVYDINNQQIGTQEAQICLAHSFGDGARKSCTYEVNAVKNLMNNIPISGYYAMNMDGMSVLNDAVGGVDVTVMDSIDYPAKNVSLHQGETKTLTGNEAYAYIRYRNGKEFNSATRRLERQKQYVESLINKVRGIKDKDDALAVHNKLKDYVCTDMMLADFVIEVKNFTYSGKMYSIPGEMKQGKNFEEYYPDREALYQMIIDIFYTEVQPPSKDAKSNAIVKKANNDKSNK